MNLTLKIWSGITLTIIIGAVAIALLTNCAMIPTRTIDPNSWVQLDPQKTHFMKDAPAHRVIFTKVVYMDEAVNVFLLYTENGKRVIITALMDAEGDGVIDSVLMTAGIYDSKTALDTYPFTPTEYPRKIHPSQMGIAQNDFDFALEKWKTGKHISLTEMNAIVKALLVPEVVSQWPEPDCKPSRDFVWFKK